MFQPIDLPFKIRQSTLETSRCLFRFNEVHVLGHREPDSEASNRGNHFHALAKRYVDYLVPTKQEMDWSYADELANGDWDPDAIQIFKYWSRQRTFQPDTVFATEYKVRLGWDLLPCEDEKAVWSADMDLVEIFGAAAQVTDYKSHWAAFNPHSIQSVLYPWLLFHLMPHLETITFTLEFVRWNIRRSRDYRRSHLPQMTHYLENQVARLVSAVQTNEWPASINAGCVYCRLDCPLVAAGLSETSVGQVRSRQHAETMAQQMYALGSAYKKAHDILRTWTSANGPIDIGNDITLGFTKRPQFAYDPKTVMDLNEAHGFDRLRGIVVNGRSVAKTGHDYPEYVTAAKAKAKDKSSTVFQFRSEIGDPLKLEDEEDFD